MPTEQEVIGLRGDIEVKGARQAATQIEQFSTSSIIKFTAISNAVMAVTRGIKNQLAEVLHGGVAYNTLQQASRAAYKTILGSSEAANSMMKELVEFAKTSPFPRQAFIQATQQLLAFGYTAKEIVPTLDAIQNAVAAAGGSTQDLAELTSILANVKSTGQLGMEVLDQFGIRGVNAAKIIAQQMGKTEAQFRDSIMGNPMRGNEAMRGLDALVKGMNETFKGGAEGLKQTWVGSIDRIAGAWRDIGGKLMEPFISPTGGGAAVLWANKFADLLRRIEREFVGPLAASLNDLVSKHSARLATLFDQINWTNIADQIRVVFGQFREHLPAIKELAVSLGQLAMAVGGSISPFRIVFQDILASALPAIIPMVTTLSDVLAKNPAIVQALVTAYLAWKALQVADFVMKQAQSILDLKNKLFALVGITKAQTAATQAGIATDVARTRSMIALGVAAKALNVAMLAATAGFTAYSLVKGRSIEVANENMEKFQKTLGDTSTLAGGEAALKKINAQMEKNYTLGAKLAAQPLGTTRHSGTLSRLYEENSALNTQGQIIQKNNTAWRTNVAAIQQWMKLGTAKEAEALAKKIGVDLHGSLTSVKSAVDGYKTSLVGASGAQQQMAQTAVASEEKMKVMKEQFESMRDTIKDGFREAREGVKRFGQELIEANRHVDDLRAALVELERAAHPRDVRSSELDILDTEAQITELMERQQELREAMAKEGLFNPGDESKKFTVYTDYEGNTQYDTEVVATYADRQRELEQTTRDLERAQMSLASRQERLLELRRQGTVLDPRVIEGQRQLNIAVEESNLAHQRLVEAQNRSAVTTANIKALFDEERASVQGVNDEIAQIEAVIGRMAGWAPGLAFRTGFSVGEQMSAGVAQGIQQGTIEISNSMIGVTRDAWVKAGANLRIMSPSKVLADEIGKPMAMGVAVGIASQSGAIAKSLTDATSSYRDMQIEPMQVAPSGVTGLETPKPKEGWIPTITPDMASTGTTAPNPELVAPVIHITVQGNVTTERQLVESVRDGIMRINRENGIR